MQPELKLLLLSPPRRVHGESHERLGEEVAAVVVPLAGASVTVEELQAHVRERLAPFKVPSRIAVWSEPLPRNPAGKVLKRDLRDGFTDGS